ncbi:MAG: BatD family protein [Gammaproteobacteria bacterium]|nr:BatD family protein [Gammaproteobacteria bacterium]
MRYRIRFLLAAAFLLLFSSNAQAASIVASLDRSQIFIDESFRVIFEADGSVDEDPDFTPLRKDFEILSQSQSTSMSFVNGQYSKKAIWSLDLMAKKSGKLTIPSVAFGKDFSPALRIDIKDPATAKKPSAGNDQDVFVQVEIDESRAWVQSQIIYNVRLFSRISMSQLGSSEPETSDPDAIIKQLGEAGSYEAFRDGVRYAVYEIRYAVFPQHSGMLEFKPMVFEGRINRGRSRSVFDQFMSSGELKRVRSDSLSIEVQARPSNIHSGEWLPAKNIDLTEEWSEDVTRLKNGEPVTRTITITAQGNMAESLPDLAEDEIKGLKQYPDKAAINNQVTDQGVTSSKQIKIALIPTRAGDFTLPAISLAWWNTATGEQEVARLPERLIRVQGEAASATPTVATNSAAQTVADSNEPVSLTLSSSQIAQAGYWPWLSGTLALGWLLTLIVLLRKNPAPVIAKTKRAGPSLRALAIEVQKQADSNRAGETKDALLAWARVCWPGHAISSLADINERVSTELAGEIDVLNASLYSPQHSSWQGEKLLKAFKAFRPRQTEQRHEPAQPLESLYK